jgi:hypothetical protein
MKMGSALLFGRMCCGLSVAVLALSACIGAPRAVRAEDADDLVISLQQMIADPIMKSVHALEGRVASVEASVSAMADSFSSRRVVAQMLCVSDDSGAQTCITKAQLDSLLSAVAHAEISRPSAAVKEAKAVPTEEGAVETTVTKDPARAPDMAGPAEEKPTIDQEPEHTGTVAFSGSAIVSYPEVEVIVVPAPTAPVAADESSDD